MYIALGPALNYREGRGGGVVVGERGWAIVSWDTFLSVRVSGLGLPGLVSGIACVGRDTGTCVVTRSPPQQARE